MVNVLVLDGTTGFYLQRDLLTAREMHANDAGRYSILGEAAALAQAWGGQETVADYHAPTGAPDDSKTAQFDATKAYAPFLPPVNL